MAAGKTRDAQCAEDVGKMAGLGYFEEEFVFFGCAYWENGHIKYRISGKDTAIYDFVEKAVLEGVYPTPVNNVLQRQLVPSGELEATKQKYKILLAKNMRTAYPRLFFETLQHFVEIPSNDSAYALLEEMRDSLEGRFNEEQLHLFEGLVHTAFEAKVLTEHSHHYFKQWLVKVRTQMEDDVIVKENFSRTFFGFAYEKDGQLEYFYNAQKAASAERKAQLERQGFLVTPLFVKTYWMDALAKLSDTKEAYIECLERVFDKDYFETLKTIKSLPSVIEQDAFNEALGVITKQCGNIAAEAFRGYGYRWNVLK